MNNLATQSIPVSLNSFEDLLSPITKEQPVGNDLRYDPSYDQIRQARIEEDATLSQGVWKRDLKKADWDEVTTLCLSALKEQTKDLQVACWLAEAWVAQGGWEEVEHALSFLRKLCEKYWASFYPLQDDDADSPFEHRLRILESFDRTIAQKMIVLPIIDSIDDSIPPYSLIDYRFAKQFATQVKRSNDPSTLIKKAEADKKATLSKINQSILALSPQWKMNFISRIKAIQNTLNLFKKELETFSNGQSPTFLEIEDVIRDALALYPEKDLSAQVVEIVQKTEAPITKSTISVQSQPSREEIYQMLRQLASHLESLEPHSPVPQFLNLLISWENKKLPEIIDSFGKSPDEHAAFLKLLHVVTSK